MKLEDKLTFGKWEGIPLNEVIIRNPAYLVWVLDNTGLLQIPDEIENQIRQRVKQTRVAIKLAKKDRIYDY